MKRKRKQSSIQNINNKKQKNNEENNSLDKCPDCKQLLKNISSFSCPPPKATEEIIALTYEKLSIFTGQDTISTDSDELPTHRITNFSIFDQHNHLTSFDNDLIENGTQLYISGYIKAIYDDDKTNQNGIPVHKMGPICEWYISGFDGGKNAIAGIITTYAQYVLVEPSKRYKRFMAIFKKKMMLVKVVIEFLLDNSWTNPKFEDLLSHINSFKNNGFDEEFLLEHAQFVCDQIFSFDQAGMDDDWKISQCDCVKDLINLTGVTLNERKKIVQSEKNNEKENKKIKSVSTPLVRWVFENFFPDQIERNSPIKKLQAKAKKLKTKQNEQSENNKKNITFPSTEIYSTSNEKYYNAIEVNKQRINTGDFVFLYEDASKIARKIGKVIYFTSSLNVHVKLFCHSSETILGETGNAEEFFSIEQCMNFNLEKTDIQLINVKFIKYGKCWFDDGGKKVQNNSKSRNDFICSKSYDSTTGTFQDYLFVDDKFTKECIYCRMRTDKQNEKIAHLTDKKTIEWMNEIYQIGTDIFLNTHAYNFPTNSHCELKTPNLKKVNEKIFSEYYRKTMNVKGSNCDTPSPFIVARIENILNREEDIQIEIRVFYRPESIKTCSRSDLNLVFWTEEKITTPFSNVAGKCYVSFRAQDDELNKWLDGGPYRFFFNQFYDVKNNKFSDLPGDPLSNLKEESKEWQVVRSKLTCLDVFAGCGGLSLGLHQAGISETLFAIEKENSAAKAFHLNNPKCKVFTEDCNKILAQIIEGKSSDLPRKGEIDLLVGGPPCQGFSQMNHFNFSQYSQFKNSLVVTFLSYCEYLRPKYFLLENVQSFTTFKKSMVLKLTLRCLLEIGYQVRFGILQAGHFGIAQTRRRLILIAAAPGINLPEFPEPQNVFSKTACRLAMVIDGKRFVNGQKWGASAPHRTICVKDAIADLQAISNDAKITDHVCKEVAPIVQARIEHIPIEPGSDWRDLPNISVKLSDGTMTQLLEYKYEVKCEGNVVKKGVCQCILGKKCNISDRQANTLIPWCLPHTADKHNHWAGLYGRLEWDGFFWTTVTIPEPMGKQGRVLHPVENRVISVRECARSQGFPDCFQFVGNVMEKYRQVGNAVPPPLGRAIGMEIRKVLD